MLSAHGISIDEAELRIAQQQANQESNFLIKDINKRNEILEEKVITYDDLVDIAHSKGYINTEIQDLLTDEEIEIADKRFLDIEAEFQTITKLNKIDITFLITAIALQVIRQYVFTSFSERTNDKEGSKLMNEKYSKKGKLWGDEYYATEETILQQPKVPFDIIAGSKGQDIKKDGKGLDGKSHRFYSLGHDPILGYLFGTANILTNTVTWWDSTSHHIKYKPNKKLIMIPKITEYADTGDVFRAVGKRFREKDGKKVTIEAVVKEYLHLKSDKTTAGLPIPFLQTISPELTQTLAEAGLDAITLSEISKQAAGAEFINLIISTIHSLLCAESGELDYKLYKVRTRKIILLSNLIASSSNLIAVGIGAAAGVHGSNPEMVKKSLKYLDVGGIIVAVAHLFTDLRFIAKVKDEFINSKLDEQLIEELKVLDKYLA